MRGRVADFPWRPFGLALAVGAAGGTLFALAQMPLAWMMGAMLATTAAALAGARMHVPNPVRAVFVTILGVLLGSAFTPDLMHQVPRFATGLVVQIGFMALGTVCAYYIYRRFGRYDPVSSFFSATPGGMSEMTILAESMGGDPRIVSLNHTLRILIVVTLIPFYFRFVEGLDVPTAPRGASLAEIDPSDGLILLACAVVGYPLARRLRFPAAQLMGPMLLSAVVHITGITDSVVPPLLAAMAQLVVGTAVGCRFVGGYALKALARVGVIAGTTAIFYLALALGAVAVVSQLVPINAPILFLSLAPGGLAEMSLIALAMGVDTAFVAIMHFLRVLIVMTMAAPFFKLLPASRRDPAGNPAD